MLLAYVDESGINFQEPNGFFKDGPYAIWSAVLVPDSKYFHLERLFYSLASDVLGIKDWKAEELHGSELWKSWVEGIRREEDVRLFFEEILQLAAKLNIRTVVGIHPKSPGLTSDADKVRELDRARYCFLHTLERTLSKMNETGVLISDKAGDERNDLADLVYERTRWRYNPGDSRTPRIVPKFKFEYQSCFLLDQLHYADSKTSLFIQFADQINFVLQRIHTHEYLRLFPDPGRPKADAAKVPVSPGTFNIFRKQVTAGYWLKEMKDVCFVDFKELQTNDCLTRNYLLGLNSQII